MLSWVSVQNWSSDRPISFICFPMLSALSSFLPPPLLLSFPRRHNETVPWPYYTFHLNFSIVKPLEHIRQTPSCISPPWTSTHLPTYRVLASTTYPSHPPICGLPGTKNVPFDAWIKNDWMPAEHRCDKKKRKRSSSGLELAHKEDVPSWYNECNMEQRRELETSGPLVLPISFSDASQSVNWIKIV